MSKWMTEYFKNPEFLMRHVALQLVHDVQREKCRFVKVLAYTEKMVVELLLKAEQRESCHAVLKNELALCVSNYSKMISAGEIQLSNVALDYVMFEICEAEEHVKYYKGCLKNCEIYLSHRLNYVEWLKTRVSDIVWIISAEKDYYSTQTDIIREYKMKMKDILAMSRDTQKKYVEYHEEDHKRIEYMKNLHNRNKCLLEDRVELKMELTSLYKMQRKLHEIVSQTEIDDIDTAIPLKISDDIELYNNELSTSNADLKEEIVVLKRQIVKKLMLC
jgi:hypothetical protein